MALFFYLFSGEREIVGPSPDCGETTGLPSYPSCPGFEVRCDEALEGSGRLFVAFDP
jgi:hypothetical protein